MRRPLLPLLAVLPALLVLASLPAAPRPAAAHPQPPDVLDAAQIRQALDRVQVTGSALYVAAHPDDENTAFLAWLANGRKVRTAYLSMTRGDGGQNLIGPDVGSLLGVIRTQELVAARRVDGAGQFFTRAIDFGYSKGPEETLDLWGRERTLADVVRVIRTFRPDIIVTRFPPDGAGGHGHHTASAILAEEAFVAAADPARFPEQLAHLRPWQAKRLVWNAFRFGSQGPDTVAGRVRLDLGAYDPVLGRSYSEIAGESRSMHKSQGFGSAERRGTFTNAFEHRLGVRARDDLFEGVDLTWGRVRGAERLPAVLARAAREFRAERPQGIVPILLEARALLAALPGGDEDPIVVARRADVDQLIRSCLGLWVEAIAEEPTVTPGTSLRVATAAIVRSDVPVTLRKVEILDPAQASAEARPLAFNVATSDTFDIPVPAGHAPTAPYWLVRPALDGSFEVEDEAQIGQPENAPAFTTRFTFELGGRSFVLDAPVVYRWTDRVQGERWRDVLVVPQASLRFEQGVTLFPDPAPRPIKVVVSSANRATSGSVRLALPAGWSADPAIARVTLAEAAADTTLSFRVTPGATPAAARITAAFTPEGGGRADALRSQELDYPHIPLQALLLPAEAHVVRADVRIAGAKLAYLMGSGDAVPDALRQMGYAVTLLGDDEVERADLSGYDAIVVGVRAYNTRPRLLRQQKRLLDYVERGGRLVVQYNTAEGALQDRLGPYPFRISRDRVTVEGAEMRLVTPGHVLLSKPNRITAEDFAGWVQERGLYYASPWDARYETPLSANDPGEPPRDGGLLYARHGKGAFIYAAHAFFRQLPAGVPGAYRLFANLVSKDAPAGPRL